MENSICLAVNVDFYPLTQTVKKAQCTQCGKTEAAEDDSPLCVLSVTAPYTSSVFFFHVSIYSE